MLYPQRKNWWFSWKNPQRTDNFTEGYWTSSWMVWQLWLYIRISPYIFWEPLPHPVILIFCEPKLYISKESAYNHLLFGAIFNTHAALSPLPATGGREGWIQRKCKLRLTDSATLAYLLFCLGYYCYWVLGCWWIAKTGQRRGDVIIHERASKREVWLTFNYQKH
jgi:hypothetical protein